MTDPAARTEPFRTPIRVSYADTDAGGVVHYANYLTYFDVARAEALRKLGMPVTEVEASGVLLPVEEANCSYLRSAVLDDLLEIDLWLAKVEETRFSFKYEVRRGAELLATGSTRHAVVDRQTRRAVRYPDWLLSLFERFPRLGSAGQ